MDEPTNRVGDYLVMDRTIEQILTGCTVGHDTSATCLRCQNELIEGDDVSVYAYRTVDSNRWEAANVFCGACSTDPYLIETRGCEQAMVDAYLVMRSDPVTQSHRVILHDVSVTWYSSPSSGNDRPR